MISLFALAYASLLAEVPMVDSWLSANVEVRYEIKPCIIEKPFELRVIADYGDSMLKSAPVFSGKTRCGKNDVDVEFKWSFVSRDAPYSTGMELSLLCADGIQYSRIASIARQPDSRTGIVDFGIVDIRCAQ